MTNKEYAKITKNKKYQEGRQKTIEGLNIYLEGLQTMMLNEHPIRKKEWANIEKRRMLINQYFLKHAIENDIYDPECNHAINLLTVAFAVKYDGDELVDIMLNSNLAFEKENLKKEQECILYTLFDIFTYFKERLEK